MSYCKSYGKDQVIFVTAEDYAKPSTVEFSAIDDSPRGLVTADGDINWDCPCLGDMPHGACGPEFKTAFSCFHYSTAEPKASDCYEQFAKMQECMSKYPNIYPKSDPEPNDELETEKEASEKLESSAIQTETTSIQNEVNNSKISSQS